MATSPTTIPLTAPRNVGFLALLRYMSHRDPGEQGGHCGHVGVDDGSGGVGTGEVGVATVEPVPAQPHDAAPMATRGKLWGKAFSRSLFRRGPTIAAATKPLVPAARWMT